MKRLLLIFVFGLFVSIDLARADDFPLFGFAADEESPEEPAETWDDVRKRRATNGLTLNFDATYVFQGVAAGGFTGPLFPLFSNEEDTGHTLSGDLRAVIDTQKAGWWEGGTLKTRLQARTGQSIVQRAGSVAAVNNEALFPNVESNFDGNVVSLVELMYRHSLNEQVGVYAGLLNTALGDQNAIAGSSQSHSTFMNFALLYSVVEDATTPQTSLGGGIDLKPTDRVNGSISIYGSDETSGASPFRRWRGTSFNTEWTLTHSISERPGAQTFGFLYGLGINTADLAADPRLVIIGVITGVPIPATTTDTWAFYYNAHQYIQGDDRQGWGMFARWGISDGNPNLVKQNAALGLGGVGVFPSRKQDHWGLAGFLVDMSDASLLSGLNVRDEFGAEAYYNIAVTNSLRVTLDAQVIDSALPRVDTAWVLGVRTNYTF